MVKTIPSPSPNANANPISPNSSWLATSPHVQRVEPMHFGCVELVEQHGSTRPTHWIRETCRVVSKRDEPSGSCAIPNSNPNPNLNAILNM